LSLTTTEKREPSLLARDGRVRASSAVRGRLARSPLKLPRDSAGHTQLSGITLNIGAAALTRASVILEWLLRRRDDLIILTETSQGPGTELLSTGLASQGYEVVATPPKGDRGVLVASRVTVRRRLCSRLDVTLPWRTVGVVLDTSPSIAVIGVYVPSRDRSPAKIARKKAFIRSFLRGIENLPTGLRTHLLIAGDYNVISRRHDPPRKGYFSYEYAMHDALERLGFASGHELDRQDRHPHSWVGRTGDGYLYDYVHLGGALHSRLDDCQYMHDTRQRRLSDHAAVAFSFRTDTD
jgi:exodeoxyribonuclease III